jgi:hypothetical protein
MKNAKSSASVESSVAKRIASRFEPVIGSTCRVCTMELCR